MLFVRTFVSTKDSVKLHLWIPRGEELSMEAEIGNLAINYNIDIKQFKEDMGIKGYLNPRTHFRSLPRRTTFRSRSSSGTSATSALSTAGSPSWARRVLERTRRRTAVTTLIGIVLLCFLSLLTGYGFAGLRRRDQMIVYNVYLLQMVIPTVLIIIPQFLLVQTLIGLVPGSDLAGVGVHWSPS